MKIYSELTRQEYPTVEACLADEELFKKKKAEEEAKRKELAETRKARAKEVEDAYKHANELLNAFVKDYGSFHMSINEPHAREAAWLNMWPFGGFFGL